MRRIICWASGHDWTDNGMMSYRCERCNQWEPAWRVNFGVVKGPSPKRANREGET